MGKIKNILETLNGFFDMGLKYYALWTLISAGVGVVAFAIYVLMWISKNGTIIAIILVIVLSILLLIARSNPRKRKIQIQETRIEHSDLKLVQIKRELNEKFKGHFELLAYHDKEPEMEDLGYFQHHHANDEAQVEANRSNFSICDPHAILKSGQDLENDPMTLKYYHCDYADVDYIRNQHKGIDEKQPEVISSVVMIYSSEIKTIILHRRSENSSTYPNCLHLFGGAFMPTNRAGIKDVTLKGTAIREVHEETKIGIRNIDLLPPFMISKEIKTGFIQWVYQPVDISAEEYKHAKTNWEGDFVEHRFSELEAKIFAKKWVPSGLSYILHWLALGAPGTSLDDWPKQPTEIYKNVISNYMYKES